MASVAPPALDLRRHAQQAPQRPALLCGTAALTYAELEALANRLADVLRSHGLVRGNHIASLLGNGPMALALAWACWRTGTILTPMATSLTGGELRYLVEDSGARVVLVDAACREQAEPLLQVSAATRLSVGGNMPGFAPLEPLLAVASPLPVADEPPGALMLYTSGTTGAPKGVVRPLLPADWRGTPPFAADLIELFGLGGSEVRYLSTAPLYHAAALRCALAVTAGGGTVVVMERFDAEAALGLIEAQRITHSQWVPAMFQRLLALPAARRAAFHAPAHRTAIHGAAPCPLAVKQAMIDWWGPILLEYYSGTEGIGLTMIDSAAWLQRPGSVGRARKGVLHIADDGGHALPTGATGLVCFSGIAPVAYHRAPEKTASRGLPEGWQTFGDVGHLDEDGFLYLTDRRDDLILSGGVNVYPQEIEDCIGAVPGVWECAVVGVAHADFGERPVAFVVPARGAEAAPLLAEVRRHCELHLGRVKRPDAIYLTDALPRSPTGKLLRRELREQYVQPLAPAVASAQLSAP